MARSIARARDRWARAMDIAGLGLGICGGINVISGS